MFFRRIPAALAAVAFLLLVSNTRFAHALTTPTLNFSPAVTHLPVVQGGSATDVFTFTGGGSFQGTVGLAISGLPTRIQAHPR
ncbi:MAG: hypothetical protein ABR905_09885 [Terracidiphilus sp.]